MTLWRSDPAAAADALILDSDLGIAEGARVLLIDASVALPTRLAPHRYALTHWDRRAVTGREATDAPTPGPFDVAVFRLCKSKNELAMRAHQAMAQLAMGGRLIVYGGNDEGIRSIASRLEDLGTAETLSTRGHGRVLAWTRTQQSRPRADLTAWQIDTTLALPGAEASQGGSAAARPWITYPGLFADGALDPATALLIDHLGHLPKGGEVLDYGCGTGIIARALLDREATLKMTALDSDSVALLATAANVPEAKTLLSDRLPSRRRYHLIVSNPPIHDGFREDHTALDALIANAPRHLMPDGRLLLVAQRRLLLDARLSKHFAETKQIADDGRFRVWSASRAIAPADQSRSALRV